MTCGVLTLARATATDADARRRRRWWKSERRRDASRAARRAFTARRVHRLSSLRKPSASAAGISGRARRGLARSQVARLREFELVAAAGAERVVELDHLAAARALALGLLGVVAIEQGGRQPDDRDDRADQEPDEERVPLMRPTTPAARPKKKAIVEVGHGAGRVRTC